MEHELDIRVYYEDTDAGGIVYYANYFKFCERGRTELLRAAGFENKPLMDREGFMFVVRKLEADYLAPAFLDDIVTMKTSLSAMNNASFAMKQSLYKHDQLIFEANVTLVCVTKSGKPTRVPDYLRKALGAES